MDNSFLIKRAQAGDSVAMNQLVEQNEALVWMVVHKFKPSGVIDQDDLYQRGMIGFVRAVKAYDPNKGAFSTLVVTAVKHEVGQEAQMHGSSVRLPANIRINDNGVFASSIDRPLFEDGERSVTLSETIPDEQDPYDDLLDLQEEQEWAGDVHKLVAALQPIHRVVITKFYGLGCERSTLVEIGEDYGLSRERVRQLITKALVALREFMDGITPVHPKFTITEANEVRRRVRLNGISVENMADWYGIEKDLAKRIVAGKAWTGPKAKYVPERKLRKRPKRITPKGKVRSIS